MRRRKSHFWTFQAILETDFYRPNILNKVEVFWIKMQVIGNIFWSFYFFEVLRCFSILKNPQEILENKFADDDKESLQVLADQEEDIDQSSQPENKD